MQQVIQFGRHAWFAAFWCGLALAEEPGDHFAAPRDLGSVTSVAFTQAMNPFSVEPGEPGGFWKTFWCAWQAPSDGICEVRANRAQPWNSGLAWGSPIGLETTPAVFQGADFASLLPVPLVSNGATRHLKQFRITAGQIYRIQVGITPLSGWIVPMGTLAGPIVVPVGGGLLPVDPNECAFALEVLPPSPPHDGFSSAHDLGSGADVTFSSTNRAATMEAGEPEIGTYGAMDTVWHRHTAPAAGSYEALLESPAFLQLHVFSGSALSGLALRTAGSPHYNDPALGRVRLRFLAGAGETLRLRARGNGYGQQGPYTLRMRLMSPPANDLRANAFDLGSSLPASGSGSTVDAGTEAAIEPTSGPRGSSSVWWRWTAPDSRWVRLHMPADQAASVGVYENGARLGWSDDWRPPVVFRAVAGLVYQVRVVSTWEDEGPVSFTLEAFEGLPHALPELAMDLGSAATVSAPAVTTQPGASVLTNSSQFGGVWYAWTAPASGWVTLDTEGMLLPARIAIQGGPSSPGGIALPIADSAMPDGPPRPVERLLFEAVAGTRYLINVTGLVSSAPSVAVRLNIRPALAPPTLSHATLQQMTDVGTISGAEWLEALVSVVAPNGLVRGSVGAPPGYRSVAFTDADRVSGDAYAGIYRALLPRARYGWDSSQISPARSFVTLRDAAGGTGGASSIDEPALFTTPALPPSVQPEADSQPPRLDGITGLPGTIVLNGVDVTLNLELGISDAGGSGFESGEIVFGDFPVQPGVLSLWGGQAPAQRRWPIAQIDATNRISGDAMLGVYAVSLTLPKDLPSLPSGRVRCRLRDLAGNATRGPPRYGYPIAIGPVLQGPAGSLSNGAAGVSPNVYLGPFYPGSMPLACEVTQAGTPDETPPVMTVETASYSATPGEFGAVTLTGRLADVGSGIASGRVRLVDVHGILEAEMAMTQAHLTSGDSHDGHWQITLPVPPVGRGGGHFLRWIAWDASGLPSVHETAGPVTLPDRTSAGDTRLPQLSSFQINPQVVDITSAPANVQVSFTAGDDRAGVSARLVVSTARGEVLANRSWQSSTASLGGAETLALPQVALTGADGAARIFLDLTDASGRTERYGPPGLRPFPFPAAAALTLAPAAAPVFAQWAADFLSPAADPLADPDGDGLSNALEFALGLDPRRHSGPAAADPMSARRPRHELFPHDPLALSLQSGVPSFRFSFAPSPLFQPGAGHALEHDGWSLLLECSTDLANWTAIPIPNEGEDGTRAVTTSVSQPGSFFRLRVTSPP